MPFYDLSGTGGGTGGGGGSGNLQSGIVPLGAGNSTGTVTFPIACTSTPAVLALVNAGSGKPAIGCDVTTTTVTNFTYQLDAPTPDATYNLVWHSNF